MKRYSSYKIEVSNTEEWNLSPGDLFYELDSNGNMQDSFIYIGVNCNNRIEEDPILDFLGIRAKREVKHQNEFYGRTALLSHVKQYFVRYTPGTKITIISA